MSLINIKMELYLGKYDELKHESPVSFWLMELFNFIFLSKT